MHALLRVLRLCKDINQKHSSIREEARAEIFEFIEVFHNRQQLHQTLGYVSPE